VPAARARRGVEGAPPGQSSGHGARRARARRGGSLHPVSAEHGRRAATRARILAVKQTRISKIEIPTLLPLCDRPQLSRAAA
jgi:hypothetical protein